MKRKIFAILMALTLVLTYMPALAFAEGGAVSKAEAKKAAAAKTVETGNPEKAKGGKLLESKKDMSVKAADYDDEDYYYGTYSGKPGIFTRDETKEDGEIDWEYAIDPNPNDSITVEVGDETYTYVWKPYDDGDGYFEIPDDPYDWLFIDAVYVNDDQTEAEMIVYRQIWDDQEEDYINDWSAIINLDKFSLSNTVSKFTFEPSTIYLVAENIINNGDGTPYYDFFMRSTHKAGGETWRSPYALGDKLTVYYTNGITQTFTNADIHFSGYNDDGYYYSYYDDCFKKGENFTRLYIDDDVLKVGNNTVTLYFHGLTTKINVVVETAAQKAAREKAAADKASADAAKAAAEKAARDRAAAEFAANGYAHIDPSLPQVKFQKPKATKKSFTAKWKKLSKKQLKAVKGIEIEYSLTPDFKTPFFKSTGKKKTNIKVKKLTSKKTYYVRAHTYVMRGGAKYVSNWSATKKVKIK